MARKRIILLIAVVLVCSVGAVRAEQTIEQKLKVIERLWVVYEDGGESFGRRAEALEGIIKGYQDVLAEQVEKPAGVREILDAEMQWRLALARALVVERTRQGRLAVEELGLAGTWVVDLQRTLERSEQAMAVTEKRLEQLIGHMRASAEFERNYVVTGVYLRAIRAKTELDYYWGMVHFYRALVSTEDQKRGEMLNKAIERLRKCCTGDGDEPRGEVGQGEEQGEWRNKAVLVIVKALRAGGKLQEAEQLLTWLEKQGLEDELAYQAALERCRLLRDGEHYDTALAGLGQLSKWCARKKTNEQLPVRLTLAYLECTVYAAQAQQDAGNGNPGIGKELSRKRLEPLERIFLAEQSEQVRRIIYEQVRGTRLSNEPTAEGEALELLAVGVDLAAGGKTAEALEFFEMVLAKGDSVERELRAEALWQAGLAGRKGFGLRACDYFGRLADEFPDSPRGKQATALAVSVGAEVRAERPNDGAAEEACFAALQRLMSKYAKSEQAAKWRLYWGQMLLGRGKLTEAVGEFGEISESDPRFVRAWYYRLECRRQLLLDRAGESAVDNDGEFARLAKEYLALSEYVLDESSPAEHRDEMARRFGGMARLAAARIFFTELDEPQTSLMVLGTFAAEYEGQEELAGTAKRYRIAALTKMGRLGEAAEVAMELLADEKADAAEVVDALLPRIRAELGESMPGDLSAEQRALAERWVKLAEVKVRLMQEGNSAGAAEREMLGRALLAAGELDRALAAFEELDRENPNSAEYVGMMGRVLLARQDYVGADRQWGRLRRGLPAGSDEWFEAWYWTLRTNAEAGVEAEQIIRRIKQLQEVDEEMGSPQTRGRFEDLLGKLAG